MALQLVGSKTFGHNAVSAQSCSLTDLTGGIASAPAAGDVVFIAYSHANATTAARTLAQCTPAGYSNLHPSVLLSSDSNAVSFAASAKQMGASPDTSVSIPAASATTSDVHCTIEVWRDVDFANIITTPATTATGINTSLPNPASISTPSAPANCVVMGLFGAAQANATTTAIANAGATPYTSGFLTGTYGTGTASRAVSGVGAKTGLAISTAFDAVLSGGATANTGSWAAVSIVIRPNQAPITANASPSLATMLSTSAAKALVEGIGSSTLNAFTASATATVSNPAIHAVASPSLGAFTASAVAKARVKANASPAPNPFISAAAAKALVEGLGSGILNAFSTAATAKVRAKANASPAIGAFSVTAAARARVKANAAPALGNFTSAGLIGSSVRLSGSPSIGQFGAASVARVRIRASGTPRPATLLSVAAAKALVEGVGSGTLNGFTASAVLSPRIGAIAAPELDSFTAEASAAIQVRAAGSPFLDAFQSQGVIAFGGPIELIGDIELDGFGTVTPTICPPSRCLWPTRPSRAVQGPARPSRRVAPNLQPRRAGG